MEIFALNPMLIFNGFSIRRIFSIEKQIEFEQNKKIAENW